MRDVRVINGINNNMSRCVTSKSTVADGSTATRTPTVAAAATAAANSATDDGAFLVRYRNAVYDIGRFMHKHPGGRNTLAGLRDRDMEPRLRTAPPHSEAAMYLLREYRVPPGDVNNNIAKSEADGGDANDDEWQSQTDESMEHLVDWSAAMLPQIGRLGDRYTDWVNKPVDRPLRLFTSDWLEMLTRTPWWLVPLFWVPVIGWTLRVGWARAEQEHAMTATAISASFCAGLLLWTILEYTLHRWVFHLDTAGASTAWCTFHFVLHGLHHKVPFDPYRLVFPPLPAVAIAALLYVPLPWLSRCPDVLLAGGLAGYLCYDMIHYYIHYGSPAAGYMYNLKRYHYQHHFVHHERGFGISSPMWDEVFDTRIVLRKLQYLLRW